MKILRLCYEWPPPWIGLAGAPYGLTKAQAKRGHEITVFSGRWPGAGRVETLNNVTLKTFFREPLKGTMLLTTAPMIFVGSILWRIFNSVDVIHVHGHTGLWFYLFRLMLGFLDRVPVVAHFHISAKERYLELKKSGAKATFSSRFLEWPLHLLSDVLAVKVASSVVCVNESVKNSLIYHHRADPQKIKVVESGIDSDLFRVEDNSKKENFRKQLNYREGDIVILNAGYFVPRKNIDQLVTALSLLDSRYKLLLVGTGKNDYMVRLKNKISELNLSDRVLIMDSVPQPELPKFYQAANLFVLPSSYEGFPKVVLEALSSGLPVLASGFELPQIRGLSLIDTINPENIASLITKLTESKVDVDSELVRIHYSWEKKAEEIDKIYNRLIDNKYETSKS